MVCTGCIKSYTVHTGFPACHVHVHLLCCMSHTHTVGPTYVTHASIMRSYLHLFLWTCAYLHVHMVYLFIFRFIGQGEFGEVFQGTAFNILGPETGPHPVAIKA